MRISDWSSDVCSSDLVHDAAAELAKAWAAADHALLFQRARRQPQVLGGFVVGEIALGLRGSGRDSGGRPQGSGTHGVNLHRLKAPGHTARPDGGSLKKRGVFDQGRFASTSRSEERRGGKEGGSTCRY